jgi:hypothetical protein
LARPSTRCTPDGSIGEVHLAGVNSTSTPTVDPALRRLAPDRSGAQPSAQLFGVSFGPLAAVWNGVPVQRCTVHKHRNLLACAPERLYDEITADYTDMIYAETPQDIADRRKAFVRKWRVRHKAVADSLEEAGDALFAFVALPKSQWKSARTTNAIERLHEEFKRRIKTQTVLPSADTAAMLFWALLASGQIVMRKIDGWNTLSTVSSDQQQLDAAA